MVDIEALLAGLTLDEKASLTAGRDMWTVAGLPEHGIPDVTMTDGPNGARGAALLGAGRVSALCVPCGSALGATWDPALVEEVGAVLGEEARTKGARVLLAPTVNLPRHPLFGRSFECYSEDPLLSGRIAAGFVRGVQSRGVAATVKHLVGNETEFERTVASSQIDERTLRELYLLPFELAIREGGAHAVMTSYNRVNGVWCAEDERLLTDLLRGDLGFDGVVMTDWFAVGSTVGSATAGLDVQMPGPGRFYGPALADAVRDGRVSELALDAIVHRWLTLIDRLGAWDDTPVLERAVELPAHRSVARRAASDSTVLLKNDGLLPLSPSTSVALIGPLADRAHLMGGGSAQLRAHRVVSIAQALQSRVERVVVEPGCVIDRSVPALTIALETTFRNADGVVVETTRERDGRLLWFDPPVAGPFTFTAHGVLPVTVTGPHVFTLTQAGRARVSVGGELVLDGQTSPPPPGSDLFGLGSQEISATVELTAGSAVEVVIDWSSEGAFILHGVKVGHQLPGLEELFERAVAAAAEADVAVVVVGTSDEWESEGHDRTSMALPGRQDELVRRVCAVNPRTVVVVNAGAPVQLDWAEDVAALVVPWLGGQEMADAVVDVLLGEAEPAGRLPVTFPERVEHSPAHGSFPGSNHAVTYSEGLLMGYRWFTSRHLPTRFPFGAGGSYTSFGWGGARVSGFEEQVAVEVDVTNTGTRRGAEVVQVYVEPPPSRLSRPRRELKGFAKVWLDPGETAVARIVLPPRAFAFWDPGSTETAHLLERLGDGAVVPADRGPTPVTEPGWYVEAGSYGLVIAKSSEGDVELVEWRVAAARRL